MYWPFKRQSQKMVKHTQTVRRQFATNCLSVFDHFVKLTFKGLRWYLFVFLNVTGVADFRWGC